MLFTNDLALNPESRSAVFKAASAYSETMEHPGIDRSVARVRPMACRLACIVGHFAGQPVPLRALCKAVVCAPLVADTRCSSLPQVFFKGSLWTKTQDRSHAWSLGRIKGKCSAALLLFQHADLDA